MVFSGGLSITGACLVKEPGPVEEAIRFSLCKVSSGQTFHQDTNKILNQHFGTPPPEMLPLDLSGAQVYQYTSGVPSASRFRPTAVVKGLPKTQLLATNVTPSGPLSEPGSEPGAVANKATQPGPGHEPVARVQAAEVQAQRPLAPKVSHEWYIDCVVERWVTLFSTFGLAVGVVKSLLPVLHTQAPN